MVDIAKLPSLKVIDLKAELKKRGLPVGGLKQVLIERLRNCLEKELQQAEEQQDDEQQDVEGESPDGDAEEPAAHHHQAIHEGAELVDEKFDKQELGKQCVDGAQNGNQENGREPEEAVPQSEELPADAPIAQEPLREAEPAMEAGSTPLASVEVPKSDPEPTPPASVEAHEMEVDTGEAPVSAPPPTENGPELAVPTADDRTVEAVEQEEKIEVKEDEKVDTPAERQESVREKSVEEGSLQKVLIQETPVQQESIQQESIHQAPIHREPVQEPIQEPVREEYVQEEIAPEEPQFVDEDEDEDVPDQFTNGDGDVSMTDAPPVDDTKAAQESTQESIDVTPAMEETSLNNFNTSVTAQSDTSLPDIQPTKADTVDILQPEEPVASDKPPQTDTIVDIQLETPIDNLKRKRRSVTPAPPGDDHVSEEITQDEESDYKKLRVNSEGQRSASTSPPPSKRLHSPPPPRTRPAPPQKDARFKNLFSESAPAPNAPLSLPAEPHASSDDDTPPTPSIHPATKALYIRNFQRPLNEPSLRTHLSNLAKSDDAIESFFLDPIKSHCFIIFCSLTAATRVRVGVHGKIWPNERARKALWADFIPEESMEGWVGREQAARGGRWEVVYNEGEDGVVAELVEVGSARALGLRGAVPGRGVPPTGPRGERDREVRERKGSAPILPQQQTQYQQPTITTTTTTTTTGPTRIIKDLDDLFRSTKAKPKLYWMPVAEDIARERLANQRRDSRGRY